MFIVIYRYDDFQPYLADVWTIPSPKYEKGMKIENDLTATDSGIPFVIGRQPIRVQFDSEPEFNRIRDSILVYSKQLLYMYVRNLRVGIPCKPCTVVCRGYLL